ncbi:hypothetical protein Ddye_021353 [Dipteronia dyeriana]|uniref:Uncharacterized protein n=1 Tax=Dipteronia dyeriana TaxID=168575 RepID=A0AAD9WXF6_9ROSI|nr:hypothetical protein Ddye_021353 [Dipteronia dyeriana]
MICSSSSPDADQSLNSVPICLTDAKASLPQRLIYSFSPLPICLNETKIDPNVGSMEGCSDSGPETLENSSSIGKVTVSNKGIQRSCFELCPLFDLPSRRTIVRELYQLYIDEKIKLKKYSNRSKMQKRILSFS